MLISHPYLSEIVRESLRGLAAHRFRAGLSLLGISWGILTVVVLLAYGNGFHSAIMAGFRGAFSDGTVVTYGGQTSLQASGERAGRPVRLTLDDVEAVRELSVVRYASPEYIRSWPVTNGIRQTTAAVRGVAPEYGVMRNERAAPGQGRFLIAEDVLRRHRVAFLGRDVHRKLFGALPAVGETIRIGGLSFDVVGVMDDKVQMSSYYSPDEYCVFIPYSTVGQLWDSQYLYTLVFQSLDPLLQEEALRQVRDVLSRRHRFSAADTRALIMNDSVENSRMIGGITGGLQAILGFIGVLTLGIGGVGVMNIMFVAVTERTREIGIRKALGARRRDILLQFLVEGVVTTFLGGLIGILASLVVVRSLGPLPFLADFLGDSTGATDIHLILSPNLLVISSVILVAVGLMSGLLPALRASRLNPIDSLRYE